MSRDQHVGRSAQDRSSQDRSAPGRAAQERSAPGRAKPGRARQRAIRAHAAAAGVSYSVAARQLDGAILRPGETLAGSGRTVYPAAVEGATRWSISARARRPQADRVRDARRAAELPAGRAAHLVERFPPARGPVGTRVGPLYQGTDCPGILAMLYLVIAHDLPQLVPGADDLAWMAELGEESALDLACAELDRAARRLLDEDPAGLWRRVASTLDAAENSPDPVVAHQGRRLRACYQVLMTPQQDGDGELFAVLPTVDGPRQILDALLIGADGGHAPGTQVRLLRPGHLGRRGTIIGLIWGASGPPLGYQVQVHNGVMVTATPEELIVPAGQESDRAHDLSPMG